MPLLRIATNQSQTAEQRAALMTRTSAWLAAELDKSEQYVMVQLGTDQALSFGGSDRPAAQIELASLGLSEDQARRLAPTLCTWFSKQLEIPTNRIYIWFSSPERAMWGFDGKTFG